MSRLALGAIATLLALWSLTNQASAQEVVSSYVTFYGFDDNDDGDGAHLGTSIISHATIHESANEDLGTYERPGTLATEINFVPPGTIVYVPALKRYYVMEDTCRECSKDWLLSRPHVDLYVSGTGPELAACEDRLTMESTKIIINPSPDLPVKSGSACKERQEITHEVEENDLPAIDLEVFFNFDSAEITPEALPILKKLGAALSDEKLKGSVFLVAGHTDAKGSNAYKLTLSDQRAKTVAGFLVENFHIDPKQLVAVGFGEEKLKNPENPLAAENRRVQVVNMANNDVAAKAPAPAPGAPPAGKQPQ